jgi:predicted GH43/DUF377 family glycosyl hydrolase
MLLDLDDPGKVIGLSREPLLVPEAPCETEGGFRNDVIFPGGMILEENGEAKVYYGAAHAVIGLATAHVDDLLKPVQPLEIGCGWCPRGLCARPGHRPAMGVERGTG